MPFVARLDPARWLLAPALALLAAIVGVVAGVDPRAAIAVSLGCAFVLLAFANITAGLAAFGFLSFIELVPLGAGPWLGDNPVVVGLLALSWLAVVSIRGDVRNDFMTAHPVMTAVLALLLAWALISPLWAESPSEALWSTVRFALNAVLFMLVFTAVRTREQGRLMVSAFLAGAVVAAIYGLATGSTRLGTGVLDPNELASVLVAGAALAAGVVATYRGSPAIRGLALAAGTFCIIAAFLTASRGGLIALSVALLTAFLFSGRWRIAVTVMGGLVAAVAVFYFSNVASDEVRDRISAPSRGQDRVIEGRTTLWRIGWRAFEANPVEGVGAGNFQTSARHYLLEPGAVARSDQIIDIPTVVHNMYLQVLVELGFVGLILFLTVVAFSFGSTLRAARNFARDGDVPMQILAISLAVALAGTLAANFFQSEQHSNQLWLLLGLGPALFSISIRARKP